MWKICFISLSYDCNHYSCYFVYFEHQGGYGSYLWVVYNCKIEPTKVLHALSDDIIIKLEDVHGNYMSLGGSILTNKCPFNLCIELTASDEVPCLFCKCYQGRWSIPMLKIAVQEG